MRRDILTRRDGEKIQVYVGRYWQVFDTEQEAQEWKDTILARCLGAYASGMSVQPAWTKPNLNPDTNGVN